MTRPKILVFAGSIRAGSHNERLAALATKLLALGDVAWRRNQVHEALGFWHRALQVQAELTDRRAIVASIERLAWGLVATGLFDAAVWLLGATDAQRQLLGIALRHELQVDHDQRVAEAQSALEDEFDAGWATGEAASVEEAVSLALEVTGAYAPPEVLCGARNVLDVQ